MGNILFVMGILILAVVCALIIVSFVEWWITTDLKILRIASIIIILIMAIGFIALGIN